MMQVLTIQNASPQLTVDAWCRDCSKRRYQRQKCKGIHYTCATGSTFINALLGSKDVLATLVIATRLLLDHVSAQISLLGRKTWIEISGPRTFTSFASAAPATEVFRERAAGYSFFSQPASKTDRASLTRTPRRSMVTKSIFKNFESRALTRIRLTNGITRNSSSEKHQRDRGSTWAGGLASSALLGMTDEQTFVVRFDAF